MVTFPAASVAVYVTIVVPVGKTKLSHRRFGSWGVGHANVGTPERLIDTVPQLSEAVATPSSSSSVAVHELVVAVTSGGTLRVGGVLSAPDDVIVIDCAQEATRPESSVAVQVIVVVPTGYGSAVRFRSSLRLLVIVTLLPVAVGEPISPAVRVLPLQSVAGKLLFDGHEIVGASGDVTIMRCVHEAERALGSVQAGGSLHSDAVHVIVVVPTGYGSLNERLSFRTPLSTAFVPV